MNTTALGLIEVRGYVGAIEAADAALKAANVTLQNIEKIRGGLVTIMVIGDVGAVKAAVEAGAEAAAKCSTILSSHVIARVHEETEQILIQPRRKAALPDVEDQSQLVMEELEETIETEEIGSVKEEFHPTIEEAELITQQQEKLVEKSSEPDINNLEGLTVEELRKLARSCHIKNIKPSQIKYGRKEFLLEILTNHLKEIQGK